MINLTLYGRSMKSSLKLLLVFAAVLTLYFSVVIWMYDPELQSTLAVFSETMPEMMAAFGMTLQSSTLTGFISTYLYGFFILIVPMVFCILTANRLIAAAVDQGWMACLLASPNSRTKIAFTQAKALASGVFLLIAYATGIGLVISQLLFPGDLDIKGFLLLNLGAFALQFFIAGFCFFSSCLFNETKYSIALGAGVPVFCYLIQMLANMQGALGNLKYATFFTLFNPADLLAGESSAYIGIAVLAGAALVFFMLGVVIFSHRDLPV